MESDKYRFLDVGGGADWGLKKIDAQTLSEDMNNLRGVKLAKENPGNQYFIFDAHIPTPIVAQKAYKIPNLHFVTGLIATNQHLPFKDESMDRVEMNHMFSPLFIDPALLTTLRGRIYINPNDTTLYLYALKEVSRVLKPGGILAITEKRERLTIILNHLSDSWGDFNGVMMAELGLDPDWRTQKLTIVTDPNRTLYTGEALRVQKEFERKGNKDKVKDYTVYTQEFRKKL